MIEAATIAQATEFIDQKKKKYKSPISQGGANVSGGQKQRLSIARAIAKHPDVYIFDDSFSALDYKTDATLRAELKEKTAESTVMIVASDTPYLWFNAAEATFLHAEYELRWGSAETAKTLYEQAVRLSFEERGASGADAYLVDATKKPAPYTDPLGNYSASARSEITVPWETATDGSDTEAVQERNLERIIVQKWIAIFPLGVEAWSEHRRTGYPKLLPVPTDKSGGSVNVEQGARRLPYPVEEYQQNNANLQAAIQTLGAEQQNGDRSGDVMGTRVWWDCKPYNK